MNNTEWNNFMASLKALPPLNNKPRPVDTDFWREMDAMQAVDQQTRWKNERRVRSPSYWP